MHALLLGGVLPIVIFTVVEEYYGTVWGLICGMVFGIGEILNEWRTQKRVDAITWFGNGLLITMGLISLYTKEGIWFKLQPAIIELAMAVILIGSVVIRKPFLVLMGKKQGVFARVPPNVEPILVAGFKGLTFRLGVFFAAHAALATWAAFHWSTRAWAILKGVGFTLSMILYMLAEVLFLRVRMRHVAARRD